MWLCVIIIIFIVVLISIYIFKPYYNLMGGNKPQDLPSNLYPYIEEKHTYSMLTDGMVKVISALYSGVNVDGEINPNPERLHELVDAFQKASSLCWCGEMCHKIPHNTAGAYIVGDIHGDLRSLLLVLEKCKEHPSACIIFLGDYVDKGFESLECLEVLANLKISNPSKIYLCRGNHENAGSPEDRERMNMSKVSPIVDIINRFRHSNSLPEILYLYDSIARFYSSLTPSFIYNDTLLLHGFLSKGNDFINIPYIGQPDGIIHFGSILNDITYSTFMEYDAHDDNWRNTLYCDENDVIEFASHHPEIKRLIKAHMHEYSMQFVNVGGLEIITINSCLLPNLVNKPYDPWFYSCIAYMPEGNHPILLSNEPYETSLFKQRLDMLFEKYFISKYGKIPKFTNKGVNALYKMLP